ncbi:hypothetical protein N7456_006786 [Penicillium angulare]|uniref:Histidine kinase domain-containing protein n=1 Tax=Penicillium angulare TaxID=116970 RepID=A0A9W9FIF8_9EURO|nr:hypothetical protein N7456_006786 [Penicillium angulare]
MFVPLWNGTDSQWFAGCFCWTPQPTRVFSLAIDLSSVLAFATSIMTEYSRVESVLADRQKGVRLIMNLLGNVLKYIRKGMVSVILNATEMSRTHKGISREYLIKRLYTSCTQEDTLPVGTGLGLSIVRGIVRMLNRKINIHSRVGEGTTVQVLLPFDRHVKDQSSPSTLHVEIPEKSLPTPSSELAHMDLTEKRVAIWGTNYAHLDDFQFWSSIVRYNTNWHRLRLGPWSNTQAIDFLFAEENGSISPFHCQAYSYFAKNGAAKMIQKDVLRRACGPQKLARGILSCLDSQKTSSVPDSNGPQPGFIVPERTKPAQPAPAVGESMLLHQDPRYRQKRILASCQPRIMTMWIPRSVMLLSRVQI